MGVSGKWIRSLVGLKKSEKPESSEKDGNAEGSKHMLRQRNYKDPLVLLPQHTFEAFQTDS
ncbi:protein IQ-DOMAIN 1 isoform X1 [Sesbania bispinosa]|nr:protein IQ-DOMAIN 1 isoform X1 [Sesbania bispinosa]